jgi:hypothetical protein
MLKRILDKYVANMCSEVNQLSEESVVMEMALDLRDSRKYLNQLQCRMI